jgi:hypothetical protein
MQILKYLALLGLQVTTLRVVMSIGLLIRLGIQGNRSAVMWMLGSQVIVIN